MMMNKKIMKMAVMPFMILAASSLMQSCIEEEFPTDYATGEQMQTAKNPGKILLNGLNAKMVEQFSYNGAQVAYDWGYPSQMLIRDILGGDEPVSNVINDYLAWIADGTSLNMFSLYTYSYYYDLVSNANNMVEKFGSDDSDQKAYAGAARAYRALAYLDMTRMFEYKTTGFSSLDAQAEKNKVAGLTVPIVTEKTTAKESKNNPRAPFYTMYRFILNDLKLAESEMKGFERANKTQPDESVVYGLEARLWLEMATRFEKNPEDLATQLAHEEDADGYAKLGVTTANECYAKAAEYAQKAMALDGYAPLSSDEWHNEKTGFNLATGAWMWSASMQDKDMLTYYWYSWLCWMGSEAPNLTWGGMGTYRCIDKSLYEKMPDADWRKTTWVDPSDVGAKAVPSKYNSILKADQWQDLPAYAGMKFRMGSGNQTDYNVAMLFDIPLMRVEEMYFILAEAKAHTQNVEAGKMVLTDFMNTYRYTDGSYQCAATDMDAFIKELMVQKRIEFWGEGLVYFDRKRLGMRIQRYYDGSNYPASAQLNSKEGKVAPWLNYYIYDYERDQNTAVVLNPDPTNAATSQTDY